MSIHPFNSPTNSAYLLSAAQRMVKEKTNLAWTFGRILEEKTFWGAKNGNSEILLILFTDGKND